MTIIKNIVIFVLGLTLFSCGNQQLDASKDLEERDSSNNTSKESSQEKDNSTENKSPLQVEVDNALRNESIDNYYKDIYNKERLVSSDDNKMLSITDSLFTDNPKTDVFYFIVFTKSMNGSDGFYSEALGESSFNFVTKNTETFVDYFNVAPKLTEKDMDNWAKYILGEIKITREGDEQKAIQELENILFNNIARKRKEYRPIIESLIEKIKNLDNKPHNG